MEPGSWGGEAPGRPTPTRTSASGSAAGRNLAGYSSKYSGKCVAQPGLNPAPQAGHTAAAR
ncbi:hypothetical protein ABIB15_003067 [Marisediminicola sp. UYEF4]